MKTISQSLIFVGIVLALVAGVFAFSAMTADAQTTCGACEEPTTPTTPGGGGNDNDNDGPTPPRCESIAINKTVAQDGESYTVSWDATPSEATFKLNGDDVKAKDSITTNFDGSYDSFRFVLYGENGGYKCSDEVVIKKEVPTCDISVDVTEVEKIGDLFTIEWEGTPSDASFTVNNTPVSAVGNATFDFIGPNFERFTFRGDLGGEKCEDVVLIEIEKQEVEECELTVTKSVDKHTATPGEELTYTIKVENTGTADCTGGGVRIQDVLDTNFEYISNTYTSNLSEGYGSQSVYSASDRTIRFNGHTLTPGESGTIVLFGKIATPHTCGDYVVKNQARATAYELNNFQDWSYSQNVKTDVDYDCEVPAPVCTAFTADPTTLPYGGGTTVLDWDLLNVATASIDNNIGDVTIGNPNVDKTMSGSRTVDVTNTTTFTLTALNVAGQEVSCQTTVVVEEPVPAPTCDLFTATPAEIFVGGTSVLTWETTNADQVFINNGIGNDDGNLQVDGSFQVSPLVTTTYVLTVIGAQDQTVDCDVPVKVKEVVDEMPVCKAFTADPTTLPVGGGNTTLAWEVEDAVDVTINNGVGTNLGLTGSQSVAVTDTTTFVLTATDADGDKVTCPALVEVVKEVVKDPAVCEAFAATPSALPVGGGDVVLNWTVLDATSVSIDNGVGSVGLVGSSDPINVIQSTTFTLTAIGEDGKEVSCPAPVAVADPAVFTCEGNVSFSASDTSIKRGQSSTLNWSTTNVDSLTISGINATALSGSESVSPSSDTTYTLEATQGDQTISCPVTIDVSTGGGGGGSKSPRCELDISAERITAGDEIELTWESSRATEVTLSDNFGNTLVSTEGKLSDAKRDLYDGSITLNPTRNTTYTLLVERGSRDRECEVDVEMDDEVVLLEVRDQAPLVAGISLTQVPYTGFEAGPVMTVLFYMLLITWALYITYVLVMPKAQLAMVPVVNNNVKSNEDLMQNAEQIRPDVFAAVSAAPVVEAPANLPVAAMPAAMPVVSEVDDTNTIENQAHALQALISSDAARTIADMTTEENQNEVVAKIVADAKGQFPLEDGWVVINQSRLAQITDVTATTVSPSPTGAGSLAEAIVTGNVIAAYDMVGNRPMIALADAAADLDAVYRIRKGADATVSGMLATETANLSEEQIAEMIAALTGALDGTYTDEASAVKMAIMKAVKIAA